MNAAINEKRVSKGRRNNSSRKKKKHWRKKIDLSEIEDALERERLELRTGGIKVAKANNELFVVEKSIDETKKSSVNENNDDRYFVDKIIVPNPSLVKPPKIQNRKDRMHQKKVENKLLNKLQRQVLCHAVKRSSSDVTKKEMTDIWGKNLNEVKQNLFKKTVVSVYTEKLRQQVPKKKPLHKQSLFNKNAVEIAHPGASYNPTFDDHQQLLANEHSKEEKRNIKKQCLSVALSVNPAELATTETTINEMWEGLDLQDTKCTTDDQDEVAETEDLTSLLKRSKPKSKRQKKHEARIEKRKHIKDFVIKREKQYQRINKILFEIGKARNDQKIKKKMRLVKVKRPVLSRTRYEEPDQEFKLPSEIQGCLRKLKPEGSVMFDRYMSLQKRCIIEPRKKFKTYKRNKARLVEKRSFKEITL